MDTAPLRANTTQLARQLGGAREIRLCRRDSVARGDDSVVLAGWQVARMQVDLTGCGTLPALVFLQVTVEVFVSVTGMLAHSSHVVWCDRQTDEFRLMVDYAFHPDYAAFGRWVATRLPALCVDNPVAAIGRGDMLLAEVRDALTG